jgi:hypothetical protein
VAVPPVLIDPTGQWMASEGLLDGWKSARVILAPMV